MNSGICMCVTDVPNSFAAKPQLLLLFCLLRKSETPREKEISYLVLHSSKARNGQNWINQKLRIKNSTRMSKMQLLELSSAAALSAHQQEAADSGILT